MLKTAVVGKTVNGTTQLTRIMVLSGDRIVLVDAVTGQPPKKVITKMVDKDLHIFAEGASDPSVIVKDYSLFDGTVPISGMDASGAYVNYGAAEAGSMELGAASAPVAAASAPLLSTSAMWGIGILAVAGGVAAAAGGGGGGDSTTPPPSSSDTIAPTVQSISMSDTLLNSGETATVTIVFSEAVTSFSNADVTVENGTLSPLTSSDNITWTATFTPTAATNDTTNVITVANTYTDIALNPGTGLVSSNYTVDTTVADTTSPTATITILDPTLTGTETTTVTIEFSEAVIGFTLADLSATSGTLSNLTTTDNVTWTATLTPPNTESTGNVITLANTYTDNAGNPGTAAVSSTYSIDTQAPILTITDNEDAITANMDGSNADGTPDTDGADILYTFSFNEAVAGFDIGDISITNGTAKTFTKISESEYTLGVTPDAGVEGILTVNVANTSYSDIAGNTANPLSMTSSSQAIDMLAPVLNDTLFDGTNDWSYDYTNKSITFTLDSPLEAVNMTNPDNFIVELNTIPVAVTAVAMLGNTVTLIMAETFTSTESVRVTYQDATSDLSAAIQDLAGNDATSFTYLKPDVTPPTVLDIHFNNSALKIGESTLVTMTFSEEISDLLVSFENGTLSALAPNADNAAIWTATFTPTADIEDLASVFTVVSYHDLNELANTGTTDYVYMVDTHSPGVSISDDEFGIGNIAGGTITYTFTFTEPVYGFTVGDVKVTGGQKATSFASGVDGDSVYTLVVTPNVGFEGDIKVDVAGATVTDLFNNPNTAAEQSVQTVDMKALAKPSFALTTDSGVDGSDGITNVGSVTVTADAAAASWEYSVDGGTTWISGNGTTFNLSSNTTYGQGDIVVHQIDDAGNISLEASNSNTITVDKSGPLFVSMDATDSANGVITITMSELLDSTSIARENFIITINGVVQTVMVGEVVQPIGGASISGTDIILNGLTFSATDSIKVSYTDLSSTDTFPALKDIAGNNAVGFTQIVSTPGAPTAVITMSDTALKVGETATVTITFSEAVSGFNNSDMTVEGGTLSPLTSSDNIIWTATFTPNTNLESTGNVISLSGAYTDLESNAGSSATITYDIDTLAPAITISDDESAATANIAGGTITYTFTFSEAVSGFSVADIVVSGGTKAGSFASGVDGDSVYTLVVTPTAGFEGNVTVDVSAAKAVDVSGNANTAALQSVQAVDMKAPTLAITDDESATTANIAGGSIIYTFTFSENVAGFSADDIVVTNGTKGAFSGSGSSYTLVVTPTTGLVGDVSVSVPAVNQVDGAGNTGTLVTVTQTVDMSAPAAPTLALATDSGIDGNDNITNVSTVNVGGLEPLATWEYSLNGGSTWTAGSGTTFTLANNTVYAINAIQVRQTDAAGNISTIGSNAEAITIDTKAPVLTITDNEPNVTANMDGSNADGTTDADGGEILYTFTFDEAVLDFDFSDIALDHGAYGTFTKVSDTVYTLGVTPEAGWEGDMTIGVLANSYSDNAGNTDSPLSMTSSIQKVDMLAPEFVSAVSDASLDTIVFTFDSLLDSVNKPDVDAFYVEIAGVGVTVDNYLSVGISGSTVTLFIKDGFMDAGESVRVVYNDNTTDVVNAIQDLAGNDNTSFQYIGTAVL
ncbi:Ig-like domain-containing protein [Sulfuricurvum sp.]|uniref:Ig-like domain-containing protein n=1 Tax=Sulfuricurvum sp. TaxID=2025608 RepID=UPI003C35F962